MVKVCVVDRGESETVVVSQIVVKVGGGVGYRLYRGDPTVRPVKKSAVRSRAPVAHAAHTARAKGGGDTRLTGAGEQRRVDAERGVRTFLLRASSEVVDAQL